MQDDDKKAVGRRTFLKVLGVGAGAAAASAAPLGAAAVAAETPQERSKTRYRESDHVKAFYRVNRYPAKS
jgi:H+/Cl- antiporter ClcA